MIKVEHTKTHEIPTKFAKIGHRGGEDVLGYNTLVTDAELVLIECKPEEALITCVEGITKDCYRLHKKGSFIAGKYLKPILISRTEKIEVGDWVYNILSKKIFKCEDSNDPNEGSFNPNNRKVLALPEHFSLQQLQMIVDGKLKEGKLVVECELGNKIEGVVKRDTYFEKQIKLNPHITIYPVEEKMYTEKQMLENCISFGDHVLEKLRKSGIIDGKYELIGELKEWFEQNVK